MCKVSEIFIKFVFFCIEVRRPTPLSTKVTKSQGKVISQSAYIMTVMETLDEVESDDKPQ